MTVLEMAYHVIETLTRSYCGTVSWYISQIEYDGATRNGHIDAKYYRILPNGNIDQLRYRVLIVNGQLVDRNRWAQLPF